MGTPLHLKLKSLDAGLAEAYRLATNNDDPAFLDADSKFLTGKQPSPREMDKAGAQRIVDRLLADKKVPPGEAEALGLIFENVRLSDEAVKFMQAQLAGLEEAVVAGSTRKYEGKDLQRVHRALDTGTGNISFQSPETGIIYSPTHYQAISRKLADGTITVVDWMDINGPLAMYRPQGDLAYATQRDRINIMGAIPEDEFIPKIVHECTHAIQDWLNVVAARKYCEADAYIAQAVVYKTFKDPLAPGSKEPPGVAFDHAAPLVMGGKALSMSSEWEKAYEKVVQAVEAHPLYRPVKDQIYPVVEAKTPSEREQMIALVDKILKEKKGVPGKGGK